MSVFKYIFDNDWSQRSDIEALKAKNRNLSMRISNRTRAEAEHTARIADLETEVSELALLAKTLMRILLTKGVCTGREFEGFMEEVDLEDGVADGKLAATIQLCSDCGRPAKPNNNRCLYCGHPL